MTATTTAATGTRLQDWIPVRVHSNGTSKLVDWCYAGDSRFTQPFFSDTLREILKRPFSSLFPKVTPLEFLRDLASDEALIPPTGFIFHMSRCGSTLLAQMLASVERNLVISEAPPIDDVLSLSRTEDVGSRVAQLTWIVNTLGRRRGPHEQNYFVKLDSWNTLELDLITSAFPDVPWIFLYREPVEVIVSQMRQRGSQMIPGALGSLVPDLALDGALKTSPEEYCARLLAKICESALQHARDPKCLLVNYSELPNAVVTSVTRHFGVAVQSSDDEAMNRAASFDAKNPRLFFEQDTAKKQREATSVAREAARLVEPFYEDLENIRHEREKEKR